VQRKTCIEVGDTFMNIKSRDMKRVVQNQLSRLNSYLQDAISWQSIFCISGTFFMLLKHFRRFTDMGSSALFC
jgi:hypothetical protein